MRSVLIAGSSKKSIDIISELLKAGEDIHIQHASSGEELKKAVSDYEYDVIIIDSPLADGGEAELAAKISKTSVSGVIMIVREALADDAASKLEKFGVTVLPKPFSRPMFYQTYRIVCAARNKILSYKTENEKLQNRLDDIRFINRAKFALMQYLNMSEPQAHAYINKQAMDLRISKREVALRIIKTYEAD